MIQYTFICVKFLPFRPIIFYLHEIISYSFLRFSFFSFQIYNFMLCILLIIKLKFSKSSIEHAIFIRHQCLYSLLRYVKKY